MDVALDQVPDQGVPDRPDPDRIAPAPAVPGQEGGSGDGTPDPVLAAARAEVVAYGARRATMTSITRRAGLSRATLYRRTASIDELLLEALTAEYEQIAQGALHEVRAAAGPHRAQIVRLCRRVLDALWHNELAGALLEHDPDLLLPYLVQRFGRSQQLVAGRLAAAIAAGPDDGSIRTDDPQRLAVTIVQALTGFVVGRAVLQSACAAGHAPADTDWIAQAGLLADSYLRPEEPTR